MAFFIAIHFRLRCSQPSDESGGSLARKAAHEFAARGHALFEPLICGSINSGFWAVLGNGLYDEPALLARRPCNSNLVPADDLSLQVVVSFQGRQALRKIRTLLLRHKKLAI